MEDSGTWSGDLKRYLLLAQKDSLPALDLPSQGVSSQLPYVLGNAWSLTGSPQHLLPAMLLRSAEKHTLPSPTLPGIPAQNLSFVAKTSQGTMETCSLKTLLVVKKKKRKRKQKAQP